MPRSPIPIQVIAPLGDAVEGATLTFKNRADSSAATHYSAETAGSSSSAGTLTDTLGETGRWLRPGRYLYDVAPPSPNPLGLGSRSNVPLDVPMSAVNEQDAAADYGFDTRVVGDSVARCAVQADGKILWSDGTLAADIAASRLSAGKLRVERPSGGLTHIEINAPTGQDALLSFSENTTAQWRLRHTASNGAFLVQDTVASRNLITFNPDGTTQFSVANTGAVNTPHRAYQFNQTVAWDGGSTDGGASTDNRTRTRISVIHTAAAGFTNTTSGTRGDLTTTSGALTTGHSGYLVQHIAIDEYNAKGGYEALNAVVQLVSKPTGTSPATSHDNYSEVVPVVSRVEDVRNMGGYAGSFEGLVKISNVSDHADAGPIQGFGALLQVQERNAYSTYTGDTTILPSSTSWRTTGARGLWIHSGGSQPVGTGIMLRGSGGFKRAIALENTANTLELLCVDGSTGYLGIRFATNGSQTIPAALTVGYTSAGAASTAEADGVNFGGDVELYRASANILKLKGGFDVNATSAAGSALAGGQAGLFLSTAGRIDIGRNSVTTGSAGEVLRVYGEQGEANPRLLGYGNGTLRWQRDDGTNVFNIAPDSIAAASVMTGIKIGTATTQKLGFWNATPAAQQTVTGSRGGNAALASLLTALATVGIVVDSSTA